MKDKKKEKVLVKLQARVPSELADQFRATVPTTKKIQYAMSAAARLWVSLPPDLRKQLIDAEDGPEPPSDSLLNLVRKIAQDEFKKLTVQK